MHDAITEYFSGEKAGAIALVVLGLAALIATALLWRTSYRGAAIPLVLIALVQLGIGVGLTLRTDRQVADLRAQLDREPAAFRTVEGARMEKVMRSFRIIEIAEVVLFLAGAAFAWFFRERPLVFAAGLGLIAQASAMLIFDLTAERRGQSYVEAIAKVAP